MEICLQEYLKILQRVISNYPDNFKEKVNEICSNYIDSNNIKDIFKYKSYLF